jgi:alpha-1,6-mannosyltransferase
VRHLPPELDAHLILVGAGPLAGEFRARADAGEALTVLPYQTDRIALAELLASSDLYLTAGPHETFGLSVLEAQASGLPAVGVRAGALVERIRPDVGELATPGDAAGLAAAVLRCLRDDPAGRGRRARAWVAGEFAWRHTFGRLVEAYRAVAVRREGVRRARRTGSERMPLAKGAAWSAFLDS